MPRLSFHHLTAMLSILFSLTSCQAQTASTNKVPPPKKTSPGIFGIGLNRDGRTLVTANFNGTVKLWDVASGRLLRTLDGHTDVVYKGVFSPDEKILASCSRDGKIKLWDAATGDELRTLVGHTRPVKAVAFSPDGRTIASVSNEYNYVYKRIRIWNVKTGESVRTFNQPKFEINGVAFTPDSRLLAAAGADGIIEIWNVNSGREERRFPISR